MKTSILFTLLAGVSLMFFSSCNKEDIVKAVPTPEGFIENDWSEAKRVAAEADRPIFVHFYKPNCTLCAEFKEDVLNDEEVESYVMENYVGTFLNTKEEDGKDLYNDFDAKGHPSLAITDKDGKLIKLHTGKMDKDKFLIWLEDNKK